MNQFLQELWNPLKRHLWKRQTTSMDKSGHDFNSIMVDKYLWNDTLLSLMALGFRMSVGYHCHSICPDLETIESRIGNIWKFEGHHTSQNSWEHRNPSGGPMLWPEGERLIPPPQFLWAGQKIRVGAQYFLEANFSHSYLKITQGLKNTLLTEPYHFTAKIQQWFGSAALFTYDFNIHACHKLLICLPITLVNFTRLLEDFQTNYK